MKQISFFTFFTIISLSHYFSQVKIDGRKLNENNGKYYSNNNLFNGNAYFLYPNEQLKEIVEFKNGEKKGVITTYYQDENYISSSYLDSVIARNLEIKNREQKTLVDKLISDTLNTCLKWRNYFTEKIGGTEKWLKLKDKYDNNKLKGKKYELVQEYINLGSYHSASVRYYLKEKKILDQFEKELKNEKSKPIYSNKISEVFKINNNLKDGYYTSFYQNGNKKTEGLINKGLKEKIWFEYFENGTTESEINYTNDEKNGQYKYFHLNGLIKETGFYKNDNNDGLVVIFDENSNKIEQYNFKDGIRDGEWKSFYENGILKEIGYFKNDLQDSVFRNFYPNGILVYECYFDNNKKNGPCKEFDFENGKLLQETYYLLNQKDGICKIYDENEKLIEETLFKSNKKNGISKLYFSNGELKEEGFFVDDKKNGSFKSYDEKGSLIKDLQYVNNEVYQNSIVKNNTESDSQNNSKDNLKSLHEWQAQVRGVKTQEELNDRFNNQNKKNAIVNNQNFGFKTVVIGSQTWMAENLNIEKFRNGDSIPEIKNDKDWEKAINEKKPAWCYYNNDPENGSKYGKLYNWYAVNDKRGLAPEGWHIPSDDEWTGLTDYLGGRYSCGKKLKMQNKIEIKIIYQDVGGYDETKWESCKNCKIASEEYKKICPECKGMGGKRIKTGNYIPKTKKRIEQKINVGWDGTNESGFSALRGGQRASYGWFHDAGGDNCGECGSASFWSSTRDGVATWWREIHYDSVGRDSNSLGGLSVRCIKD